MDLDVTTRPDGIAVVVPQGRLNMVSARTLKDTLSELVAGGTTRIVVDMGETSFLDSSGLGALIGGLVEIRVVGTHVVGGPVRMAV